MAKPSTFCLVSGCRKAGSPRPITFGSYSLFRIYCRTHFEELKRLQRQGQRDWGRSHSTGFNARMYYASKKGFHAY